MNTAYLLIGSNIDPLNNTQKAMTLLSSKVKIDRISHTWVIPSIGSPGPDFLNFAIQIETDFTRMELKNDVIAHIEQSLHRVRSSDKNAPRTIDIDIIVFNGEVVEPEIWNRPYEALPISDLLPDLVHPGNKLRLYEISRQMEQTTKARLIDNFSKTP